MKHKVFILVLLAATTFSCSSEKQGLKELKRLCEKDAGLTVYETVEAKGYYDDYTKCHHCWYDLIRSPFEYLEFCDFESERHSLTYILQEHGCYRLSKVPRSSGQCHKEIEEQVDGLVVEPFAEFKKNQCVSVQSIDKSNVLLGLFVKEDKDLDVGKNFSISRYEYVIQSLTQSKHYGRFINYSLTDKRVWGAQHGCGSSSVVGKRVSVHNPSLYKAFTSKIIKLEGEI